MADMTPDEAIAKLRTLPEDQQRQVLSALPAETRGDILKKLQGGQGTPTTPAATPTTQPSTNNAKVSAQPPFFSAQGMKEHGYRAARALLDLLPTAGGIGGGLAGGAAGIESGPGAVATAGAGAAAGGVLGEKLKKTGEHMIFGEPDATAGDLMKEGAIQGLNEVTGQVGSRALAPAAGYFGRTALKSAETGVKLLPSEAAGGAESYVEKFLKGSVLTSGRMEKFRAAQNAQTKAAAEAVADKLSTFTGTPEQVGLMVQKGLEAHTAAFRAEQNKLYGAIDDAVREKVINTPIQRMQGAGFYQQPVTTMKQTLEGPAMPSTAGMKKFAREQLQGLTEQEKILDPALLSQSRGMLQNILNAPDKVTFRAMADTRSDLLSLTRRLDEALPGKQAGMAKKLAGLADESMMDAANAASKADPALADLPKAIRQANELTAKTHEIYEQNLIKKIVDTKRPEAISKLITGNVTGNQETRDLMKILPANIKPAVQRQVIMDTLNGSVNQKTGMLVEKDFVSKINKLGDERGQIIFGSNWKNIKDLTGTMALINGSTSGIGGASLANFSTLKNILMATGETFAVPFGLATAGRPMDAIKALAVEGAALHSFAWALTNPAKAEKMVKAAKAILRGAPYAATAVYEGGKTQTKATRDLQAIRDKHVAEMQPTQ